MEKVNYNRWSRKRKLQAKMKSVRAKRRQTPSISELESGEASSSSHLCSTEAISQESMTFYSSMITLIYVIIF